MADWDVIDEQPVPRRKTAVAGGWDVVEEAAPEVLGVAADIASDPLLQFDGFQMTPDGFVPAPAPEHFNQPRVPVDRSELGDLIGIPMQDSEAGDLSDLFLRGLADLPQLAVDAAKLPLTGADALVRSLGGDPEQSLAMVGIRRLYDTLGEAADYLPNEMDAIGMGRGSVDGGQLVEALNPSTEMPLGDRLGDVGTFALEQSVRSTPQMAAALASVPAYVAGRAEQVAERRVENDGRELVTLPDLGIAVPAAAVEALLERFTTARLLPGGTTINSTGVMDALGGILREIGLQGGLGGIEELAPYLAETAGTEQGSTLADAVETFAAGAVTEGAMGAAGQGAKEVAARLPTGRSAAPSADAGAPSPSAPPSRPLGEASVDELDALLVQNIPELAELANPDPAPAAATPTPTPERASLPAQDFVAQLAARMRQSSQEQAARTAGQPAQSPAAPVGSRPAGGDLIREPDGIAPERPQRYSAPDLRQEIGWSQRGGELVRAAPDTSTLNDEERLGLVNMPRGEVTGRTRWTGWPDPTGEESVFWRNRPDKGLSEKQANAALDKFERGEPLKAIEQRFVDHAEATAREYGEAMDLQDDAMRGYEAQGRQQAIEEIRAEIDVAEPDADAALSLYEIARQAAERGVPDTEITPARGESEPAYAARLWRRIKEADRGTDTPAAAEDRGQGSTGREGGPERPAFDLAAEAVPEPAPRQEVAPGLFGAPSTADFVDAARRDRDSQRDGRTGTETPSFTGTPLGAGPAPEQGRVPERDEPVESVEPFYSAATRAITEGKGAPKRGDAGAWKGWLDGAVRRGDMKQSERDWLGVDDFIASKPNVTREELAEFVQANQVQVQDVVLAGPKADGVGLAPELEEFLDNEGFDPNDIDGPSGWLSVAQRARGLAGQHAGEDDADGAARMRRVAEAAETMAGGGEGVAKFHQWQLPGGENYRELLLTLPPREKSPYVLKVGDEVVSRHPNRDAAFDALNDVDQLARSNYSIEPARPGPEFASGHFDQPNILAHVRFNERTDADGKRVLFLEEIQSDWHQAGRKKGYARPIFGVFNDQGILDATAPTRDAAIQKARDMGRLAPESAVREVPGMVQGVPDAPFKATDEWAMLAFKRMVRWAAEHGFDRIAWTTGDQQAERYDLSKQVETILATPRKDATTGEQVRRVAITMKGGTTIVFDVDTAGVVGNVSNHNADLRGKPLDEVVGKDMADKIMAAEGRHEFTGPDLKIGGGGMRAFYDSILPKAVNKWAKRFGGRVGEVNMLRKAGPNDDPMDFRHARDVSSAQHGIDLTPAMREAALEGLPLFSTEATESDLSPDETASLSRQRERGQVDAVQRETRATLSRQRGESDAASRGLKEAVDKVLPGNDVQFIRGMDGLPEHVRTMLESRNRGRKVRTAGLYDPETGTAYILTDVVTDPKRAAWHAAHELAGHHGLRGVIAEKAKVGNRTAREALDVALDIALQNPTVSRLAKAIGTERKSRDRLLMAEEALAELAAATRTGDYATIQSRYGVDVPQAQRKTLAGAIARFIERIRNIFKAIVPDTFSDSDVAELVEGAWRYARGEGSTTGDAAEQVVFHGTPHRDIQRFSLHAIGTGEGAQAFGWGLYFAGRKEVAEHYRKGLSTRDFIMRAREAYDEFDSPSDAAAELLADPELSEPQRALLTALKADDWLGFDYPHQAIQAAIREPDSFELSPETRAALDRQGQLYRVDVPEDSDLLDWDKPLAEQPPKVRAALEMMFSGLDDPRHHGKTGRHFYLNAVEHFTEAKGLLGKIKLSLYGNRDADPDAWREASEALRDAGIPGLRYLDGSSRRRGDGSYNYVIWDESAIGEPEGMLESVDADDAGALPQPPRLAADDVRRADRREAAEPGLIAKAKQDVADELAGWKAMSKGRPKNPQTLTQRANALRSAIFDSVVARARDIEARNPQAKSLRRLFNAVVTAPGDGRLVVETLNEEVERRFAQFTNRVRNILSNEGMDRLTDKQNTQLRETLLGTRTDAPAPIQRTAKRIRKLIDNAREDLLAAGVEVGEVEDIGYLTRLYDDAAILTDEAGFLADAETLYEQHEFGLEVGTDAKATLADPEKLARFLAHAQRTASHDEAVADGLSALKPLLGRNLARARGGEVAQLERAIAAIRPKVAKDFGRVSASAWLHKIKTPTVSEVFNGIGASGAPLTKARVLSGAADTVMAKWLNTNLLDILDTYARTSARKVAQAQRFGPKGEKVQELIDAASREGVPKHDLDDAVDLMESALGSYNIRINPKVKSGLDALQAWTYLGLLGRVTFSSAAEAITFSIRTGNLSHALAPVVQVMRAVGKTRHGKDLNDMALMIGLNGNKAMEEVMQNQLGGDYGMEPKWSKLVHRFMTGVLLTPLTRAQRAYGVGAATGYLRWISGNIANGRRVAEMGVYLNELGIADHEAFSDWMLAQGTLPNPLELHDVDGRPTPRGQDYMTAVRRMVDQSIQNPNASHRPAWMNNPAGRVAGSIMGFSYAAYENVIRREFALSETLRKQAGARAQSRRMASAIGGMAALALGQTLVSTLRELLFSPSRFEDKEDEEIAEEMAALGLSRTFGLGSGDPMIQYLTGLKYQRGVGETLLGASAGTLAERVDAIASVFTDRNSPNTDTTEYRAMEAVYAGVITPVANAVLSRLPFVSAPAIWGVSSTQARKKFAGLFFDEPDVETALDRKYQAAIKELNEVEASVKDRIAMLPKDQWAHELARLREEYPTVLSGVTLDLYVRGGKYGGPGDPKQTADGKPQLELAEGDAGSVMGELEGYPFWYTDGGKAKQGTTDGIQDRITGLNKAIKNLRDTDEPTLRDLMSFAREAPSVKTLMDRYWTAEERVTRQPASRSQVRTAVDELQELRRAEQRKAIDVIERAERGEAIPRSP